MQTAKETVQERARRLRYKLSIVKDINLEQIQCDLFEMQSECDDIRYWFADDDEDLLIDALDGNEDAAHEYKMLFSDLSYECEQMQEDLDREYVPECFDDFFTAISDPTDEMLGWDSYEGDYFGISGSWDEESARQEAQKRINRLTKAEIIETAQTCFRIFRAYVGLTSRYDYLKAAIEILKGENASHLKVIEEINAAYEAAARDDFKGPASQKFDKLISSLPDEVWAW